MSNSQSIREFMIRRDLMERRLLNWWKKSRKKMKVETCVRVEYNDKDMRQGNKVWIDVNCDGVDLEPILVYSGNKWDCDDLKSGYISLKNL